MKQIFQLAPYISLEEGANYITLWNVPMPELPEKLTVKGHKLTRKDELHISLVSVKRLPPIINSDNPGKVKKELVDEFRQFIHRVPLKHYRLTNNFYFLERDDRKAVVALAEVPGMEKFFTHLNKKYNMNVPMQQFHVTLYTLLPDKIGAGLPSKEELDKIGTKIDLPLKVGPQLLRRIKFGHPILRDVAKTLSKEEVLSPRIQQLIANMRYTVDTKEYGVGLAAPQVGEGIALSVIAIKPTPARPGRSRFDMVIINPEIVETFGRRTPLWEGCISCGTGSDTLYAEVPRYKKVKLRWLDDQAKEHERILEGLPAHVAQHEVDHLNGMLFVDRVKNTHSYMMASEFRKRVVKK